MVRNTLAWYNIRSAQSFLGCESYEYEIKKEEVMLDICRALPSKVSTIFCERSAAPPGLPRSLSKWHKRKNSEELHASPPCRLISCLARSEWRSQARHYYCRAPPPDDVTRLKELLDRLLKILKNGLISSMYATAQKCLAY